MKKVISIILCVLLIAVLCGCSGETKKTPEEWCIDEVIYWHNYHYPDYFCIGTITAEINTLNKKELEKYERKKTYRITLLYEDNGGNYIYTKTYVAYIYYIQKYNIDWSLKIKTVNKTNILDLDVEEIT